MSTTSVTSPVVNIDSAKINAVLDLAHKALNGQEHQVLFRNIGLKLLPSQTVNIFNRWFLPCLPEDVRQKFITDIASIIDDKELEPCARAFLIREGLTRGTPARVDLVLEYITKEQPMVRLHILHQIGEAVTTDNLNTFIKESIRQLSLEQRFDLTVSTTESLPHQQQANAMQKVLKRCPDESKPFFAVKLLKTLPDFSLDSNSDVDMAKELLTSGFNLNNTARIVIHGLNSLTEKLTDAVEKIPGRNEPQRDLLYKDMAKFAKHVKLINEATSRCLALITKGKGDNAEDHTMVNNGNSSGSTSTTPNKSPLKRQASASPPAENVGPSKSPKKQAGATANNRRPTDFDSANKSGTETLIAATTTRRLFPTGARAIRNFPKSRRNLNSSQKVKKQPAYPYGPPSEIKLPAGCSAKYATIPEDLRCWGEQKIYEILQRYDHNPAMANNDKNYVIPVKYPPSWIIPLADCSGGSGGVKLPEGNPTDILAPPGCGNIWLHVPEYLMCTRYQQVAKLLIHHGFDAKLVMHPDYNIPYCLSAEEFERGNKDPEFFIKLGKKLESEGAEVKEKQVVDAQVFTPEKESDREEEDEEKLKQYAKVAVASMGKENFLSGAQPTGFDGNSTNNSFDPTILYQQTIAATDAIKQMSDDEIWGIEQKHSPMMEGVIGGSDGSSGYHCGGGSGLASTEGNWFEMMMQEEIMRGL